MGSHSIQCGQESYLTEHVLYNRVSQWAGVSVNMQDSEGVALDMRILFNLT